MQQIDTLWEPARVFLVQIGEFLPRALVAIAIVLIGWLVAKALRFAVVKTLRAINFHVLTERSGVDGFLRQGGGDTDTTDVLGVLVYGLVILTALMIAFNSVGLAYVTDLIGRVVLFVPRVILAVVIIAFGAYFGRFVGRSVTAYCRSIGVAEAVTLGRIATYAVIVFVLLIALEQLGVGDLIRQSFLILLGAVALALAIAFGLGGQKRAAEFLDRWGAEERLHESKAHEAKVHESKAHEARANEAKAREAMEAAAVDSVATEPTHDALTSRLPPEPAREAMTQRPRASSRRGPYGEDS